MAAADVHLVHPDLRFDEPEDGSILTIRFAVERARTSGTPRVGDGQAAVDSWEPQRLADGSERTRLLDLRCVEAASQRLRGDECDVPIQV